MRKLERYTQLTQTDDVLLERLEWCNLRASPLKVGRSPGEITEGELLTQAAVYQGREVYVVIRCVQCQIVYQNCLHACVSE